MTITLTREEAQQVLDALEDIRYADISERQNKALETLRARLAQPEPEPVMLMDAPLLLNGQPLYTAPPQREWQGLTDEEVETEAARILTTLTKDIWPIALSRAIEDLLRRKNK